MWQSCLNSTPDTPQPQVASPGAKAPISNTLPHLARSPRPASSPTRPSRPTQRPLAPPYLSPLRRWPPASPGATCPRWMPRALSAAPCCWWRRWRGCWPSWRGRAWRNWVSVGCKSVDEGAAGPAGCMGVADLGGCGDRSVDGWGRDSSPSSDHAHRPARFCCPAPTPCATLNPPSPSPPQATLGSAQMQCGLSSPSSPQSYAPTTGT